MTRPAATTTATPSTPIPPWRGRSTTAASAGRSASSSRRAQARVLADFVGRIQDRAHPRRRHRHRPRRAPARARRRAGHRRGRVGADARDRARPRGRARASRSTLPGGRRARARLPGPHRSTWRSACACSCTRRDWRQLRRRAVPRRRPAASSWTTRRRRASRCSQSLVRRVAHAAGRAHRAVPRLQRPRRSPTPSPRTASASGRCTASSCCRSRCTRRSDPGGSPMASERVLERASACCALFGSPVTIVAERCASS